MQERHRNREVNVDEQAETTRRHVLPFIATQLPVEPDLQVLEVGCGEGGNLKPFLDLGCHCVGVDVDLKKIAIANIYFQNHPHRERLRLVADDVYNLRATREGYDLIMLRDSIEHIPSQKRLLKRLPEFLKPQGLIFVGFPPWQNPFGGHQHHLHHPLLSRLPYWHLLPSRPYAAIMRAVGEHAEIINEMLAIKRTGLSIEAFESILNAQEYRVRAVNHFLINPNFEIKFGLRPRFQLSMVSRIPWIRNFLTTTSYYLLSPPVACNRERS